LQKEYSQKYDYEIIHYQVLTQELFHKGGRQIKKKREGLKIIIKKYNLNKKRPQIQEYLELKGGGQSSQQC